MTNSVVLNKFWMLYKVTTKIVFVTRLHPLIYLNTHSLWSKVQINKPKDIFNFTIKYLNNTLGTKKNLCKWSLSPRHLHAPSAFSLKLFKILYLVASPTLMSVGIPDVITQFFGILLNLCHLLSMPHYMLIFPLFHLRLSLLVILSCQISS